MDNQVTLNALLIGTTTFSTKDNTLLNQYNFLIDGEVFKLYTSQPIQIPENTSSDLTTDPLPVKITLALRVKNGQLKPRLLNIA